MEHVSRSSLPPLFDALAEAMPGLIKVARVPSAWRQWRHVGGGELTMGGATRRAVGALDGTAAIRAARENKLPRRWPTASISCLTVRQLTEEFFEWVQRQLDGSGRSGDRRAAVTRSMTQSQTRSCKPASRALVTSTGLPYNKHGRLLHFARFVLRFLLVQL